MEYPYSIEIKVPNIFEGEVITITLYSGVTTLVGPNGSGKTQTLKSIRDRLKSIIGPEKVRYLTSNRIGTMEVYRSRTVPRYVSLDDYSLGDQEIKRARHQIETATGDFFAMDDRKDVYIKVSERLSVLFNRQIFLRWDAGRLKVFCERTEKQEEYSVAVEASGLINVISILAALYDDSVEVLLIDEPEVSLHPQLQYYLLREIRNAASKYGKTVIISTHSPEMIGFSNAKDLCNYVFFQENGDTPIQISPEAPELESKKLQEFLLRMGLIYKEAFFAKKILLIEGSSDLIICRYLSNRLHFDLDIAGTQIIPVEGKGQFPIVTKLFRLIGKKVGILTDLDGFIDDNSVIDLFSQLPEAVEIANSRGLGDFHELIRSVKATLNDLVQGHKETMRKIYEDHPYWINRDSDADESTAIRRSIVAKLFAENDESIAMWPDADKWRQIKIRLRSLLDGLEDLGCFVLLKGAIESYYKYASKETFTGKPSAAVLEVSQLQSDDEEQVKTQYSDIIRALKFAELDKVVDESFAVKKELLSELALVLGILNDQTTEATILAAIKQARGNSNSLFKYEIIRNNDRLGVEVSLNSTIINVTGFPFKIFKDENVNRVVATTVKVM